MTKKLDSKEIANKYNRIQEIWDRNDSWHWKTYQFITKFIAIHTALWYEKKYNILNAGSAGNAYGLPEDYMIHIDIAKEKIKNSPNSIVGSIENIPIPSKTFDAILCVGSVINYCDPIASIQEFSRLLKTEGKLILEFENSNTLELFGTKNYNKNAILINTFYKGKETIWLYSERFILEVLKENNFIILAKQHFHILSPLIYRLTKNINIAAQFIRLDNFFKKIPFFKNVSSNMILLAEKKS